MPDTLSLILMILGMVAVTFSIRFILFARAHRIQLPVWLEEALAYVPVAVLTAIIMPMILMPNKQLDFSWHNPWLLGGLAAFVVGLILRKPLVTIIVGVLVFFGSQFLLT
ncbi:AzlD domain-containing protein [Thiothrix eikelboomii]|uniref:Branched-chain amino acid transport protein n=1 Tax=Thiothrix eikelboomii TaxID=92487 RepID=A0A1T4W6A5_9GAMM|nr:AzlD domain-containing protein [Thiothrix eikelboomii]SKA72565.1 Branched-chain amino acid transport protein [Thiothrix eikelboomii]